jgi:DnaJ-class molecular chaperone
MFKSEDENRQEAAIAAGRVCDKCHGTGTIGIGGRGALSASPCGTCNGSGMK